MEDISFKILRIPWNHIDYSTIEDFFKTPQIENDQLEFKSYDSKREPGSVFDDLAREICAFLNSEGGILIWGAPIEDKRDKRNKTCYGDLTSIPDLDTDDVVRKITGKIVEMPLGIQVKRLQNNGKNLFIFQIPKSQYRPHQTNNQYYMRLHASCEHAPHHYVEALMKRVRYPDLRGHLEFTAFSYKQAQDISKIKWIRVDFLMRIENNSPFQNEESPKYIIYCDQGTPIEGDQHWPLPEHRLVSFSGGDSKEIIHYGEDFKRQCSLGFDSPNLYSEGYQFDVILKFGGRFSPLKLSHYKVDLSFFSEAYLEDRRHEFPDGFVKAKENILIVDSDYNVENLSLWESMENY